MRKLVLQHSTTIPSSAHDERRISPGYDPERAPVQYGTDIAREEALGNRLSDAKVVVGSPVH